MECWLKNKSITPTLLRRGVFYIPPPQAAPDPGRTGDKPQPYIKGGGNAATYEYEAY